MAGCRRCTVVVALHFAAHAQTPPLPDKRRCEDLQVLRLKLATPSRARRLSNTEAFVVAPNRQLRALDNHQQKTRKTLRPFPPSGERQSGPRLRSRSAVRSHTMVPDFFPDAAR